MNSKNPPPAARLLSNGAYFTLITAAGTGQSRRHGHVANRWYGDPVEDAQGQFLYLKDAESNAVWSAALQPTQSPADHSETSATPGSFTLLRRQHGISSELTVAVVPGRDFEVRQLVLKNDSPTKRTIEVTSLVEAVLNWQGADFGHPAFSKLFVQTGFDAGTGTLFAERRPRANNETWPCLFHAVVGGEVAEFETDRLRFIGRGRTVANPSGIENTLSGTVGNVLDPCLSLRTLVELAPGESKTVSFLTGIGENRAQVLSWSSEFSRDGRIAEALASADAAELSTRKALGVSDDEADQFQSLAATMHYADRSVATDSFQVEGRPDLNALFGKLRIPRDRMTLLILGDWSDVGTQLAWKARAYWGTKGFFTNFVLLTKSNGELPTGLDDRFFGIPSATLSEAEINLLRLAAALVVEGSLPIAATDSAPVPAPRIRRLENTTASAPEPCIEPALFNGYGGFSPDGSEYIIQVKQEADGHRRPPLPWLNVVANEHAGFLVSESGAGCTWTRNSQANRLTPWSNEPVADPHGEALFLRDEATGNVWSPTPGPVPAPADYEIHHGFGYSTFHMNCDGLRHETTLFVPRDQPVKIVRLRVTNTGATARQLSLTSYQRLILGSLPEQPSPVVTSSAADGSLRAFNTAAGDFRGGIAFSTLAVHGASEPADGGFSCNRASFIGRHGASGNPAAMLPKAELDGAVGAGFDPCFAQRRFFTLTPGATVDCVVLLGEALSDAAADAIVASFTSPSAVDEALQNVVKFWRDLLRRVQVKTPSPAINFMVNGWLAYQTLACRMWGRSAFYQSSGAYGYRDQLQDSASLLALDPSFARHQLLLHAAHQFVEGDVLHWWHPEPIERGLRTTFSDDLLWLPLLTTDYIAATGDRAILAEEAPFITAAPLAEGHDEVYLTPEPAGVSGDLYDHCCRAIDRSLKTGAHGLPLMGCGDWNDGMNRVGREGRGESVWVGFFLHLILERFIPLCSARGDHERIEKYTAHRTQLHEALNAGGWDGEWYRRAYYDNGDPLGSKSNDECRIDALAQSWAVISKAASAERAASAMQSMLRELVSEEEGLIRLLTPPFVNTANDPGYIKGYVAGVRENGGQYTHAATWVVKAVAEHGDNERAARLLEMLTPVSHARTREAADRYKVEPYVVCADVYGAEPHIGRGGWTWYTGSCGWLYRVALESILGIRVVDGTHLAISPRVPSSWTEFEIRYQPPGATAVLAIQVRNPNKGCAVTAATLSGEVLPIANGSALMTIPTDPGEFQVEVTLG